MCKSIEQKLWRTHLVHVDQINSCLSIEQKRHPDEWEQVSAHGFLDRQAATEEAVLCVLSVDLSGLEPPSQQDAIKLVVVFILGCSIAIFIKQLKSKHTTLESWSCVDPVVTNPHRPMQLLFFQLFDITKSFIPKQMSEWMNEDKINRKRNGLPTFLSIAALPGHNKWMNLQAHSWGGVWRSCHTMNRHLL